MNRNFDFADVNTALPGLCQRLLGSPEVGSRLGDKTAEIAFASIRITKPLRREILLPSRKSNLAAQIAETMWVLAGKDDVGWLRNYLPRAEDFSDDGERWRGAYGPRLRAWTDHGNARTVDQLAHVVKLLNDEPTTRRAVMTIYDPARDTDPGKDIPCNNWLSWLSRDGYLDLHVAIRSNDVIWGWSGINQFEWSALLEIVAGLTGLKVGCIHYSITSLHLYDKHYDRAREIVKDKQLDPPKESPRFSPRQTTVGYLDWLINEWFAYEKALRNSDLDPLALNAFPEPMMRSWLQVIGWYWSGDSRFLDGLGQTALYHAALLTKPKAPVPAEDASSFVTQLASLHAEKHAAYGDSWKKRGEQFSILPNIARKVDRLGTGKETADETTADTAADLLIYLIKYRLWLQENVIGVGIPSELSHVELVTRRLTVAPRETGLPNDELVNGIRFIFDSYLDGFDAANPNRAGAVDSLISLAGPLAYRLWRDSRTAEPEEQMHAKAEVSA